MKIAIIGVKREELTDEEWAARCAKSLPVIQHWLAADREMVWLGIVLTQGCAHGVSTNPGVVTVTSTKLDVRPFNIFMWGNGAWPVDYYKPDPETGFDQAHFISRLVANQILAEIGLQFAEKALGQSRSIRAESTEGAR